MFPGYADVVEIGAGTLATVYRAREVGTGRTVALKLLTVREASPRAIESFERESLALGALSAHPNIVTLFGTFRAADGRPVLALELCAGAVSDRLRDGRGVPVRDAVSIGIKICAALETAHRGGILHRDVKPQDILVTEFGEPALADFGVAMLQSSTQPTTGLFDFTTLHAAPELLEGAQSSAATDVYELASTLYQMIDGQPAFHAYAGEPPASVILRILRDPVRPLVGAEVPFALSDLLIQAMSKDRESRPSTAAQFAAALADVAAERGWSPTPFLVRPVVRAPPHSAPEPTAAPEPESQFPVAPVRIPGLSVEPNAIQLPPGLAGPPVPSVPVWAVRTRPAPVPAPQFVDDMVIDPDSLRSKLTVRAGRHALTVDGTDLVMRAGTHRERLAWSVVRGFQPRFETGAGDEPGLRTPGILLAVTASGPVELAATRRPAGELRHLHALLDAYRVRAQHLAAR